MADREPRIPSIEDIRWLFEQLPDDRRHDDDRNAPPPPSTGGHEETSHE